MKYHILSIVILTTLFFSCSTKKELVNVAPNRATINQFPSHFNLAFGSCNKHDEPNNLWDDILVSNPDVWIWGGDIVYSDTYNMKKLRRLYNKQNSVAGYAALKSKVPVIGTWDDHDYGVNDSGSDYSKKNESQQELLNFLGVPEDSPRRKQEGIYSSHDYNMAKGSLKIIVLDTRYFRTSLTPSKLTGKRYEADNKKDATILGAQQWKWLENELTNSEADFNVIVSSIQVLSSEHGFETWGNFPEEAKKLMEVIVTSKANGVIILSGDRHISEFSKIDLEELNYPLIDFTSSGLTHSYDGFNGEPNPYRIGNVVSKKSFGLLRFNFETRKVQMQIKGDNGTILQELEQTY